MTHANRPRIVLPVSTTTYRKDSTVFEIQDGPTDQTAIIMYQGKPLAVIEVTREYQPHPDNEYDFPQVESVVRGVSVTQNGDVMGRTLHSSQTASTRSLVVPGLSPGEVYQALHQAQVREAARYRTLTNP